MGKFKKYRRKKVIELREVTEEEIKNKGFEENVSVSALIRANGSPKKGDMVVRHPKNPDDKWLISKDYFEDNFEEIEGSETIAKVIGEE